jgi:hypothetical protein
MAEGRNLVGSGFQGGFVPGFGIFQPADRFERLGQREGGLLRVDVFLRVAKGLVRLLHLHRPSQVLDQRDPAGRGGSRTTPWACGRACASSVATCRAKSYIVPVVQKTDDLPGTSS